MEWPLFVFTECVAIILAWSTIALAQRFGAAKANQRWVDAAEKEQSVEFNGKTYCVFQFLNDDLDHDTKLD